MKTTRTLTFEVNKNKLTIGDALEINDERGEEIGRRALEIAGESKSWGETLSKLLEEFDGNEFLYAYGMVWFVAGTENGRVKAILEMKEAVEQGRNGQ